MQLDYMDAGVNLVEIDLVRQGYMICVDRDIGRISFDVYFASMREPLPNIAIPLRADDRDVDLRLQPLLDDCNWDGRYYLLDYTRELSSPLSHDDS